MKSNLEDIKKIPLAEFCLKYLGYKAIKDKDSKMWRSLESPHGIRIITKRDPYKGKIYLYKNVKTDSGGTLIDLLLKEHNFSWQKILKLANPTFEIPKPTYKLIKPKENFTPLKPKKWFKPPPINYLTQRGISNDSIKQLKIQTDRYSAHFPIFFLDEKNTFKIATYIKYYFSYGKRKQLFLDTRRGGISVLRPREDKKKGKSDVYLFESPIDAASYYQLFSPFENNHNFFMSICGTPSSLFKEKLNCYLDKLNCGNLYFCLDNDEAGIMNERSLKLLVDSNFTTTSHIEKLGKFKDWNELLTSQCAEK